ncbi:MAG: hypothetical protein WDN28_04155 [Chthoniobacter sp.]
MVDHRQPRARRDRREDCFDDLRFIAQREGNPGDDDLGSRARRGFGEHVAACIIIVVGGEQFVAGRELQRAHDRVHARGGVGDEDQVVRLGLEEGRQLFARGVEQIWQIAPEKLHRLALHAGAQFGLGREDGAGAGAEAAVIEEDDAGVERPVIGEGARHGA